MSLDASRYIPAPIKRAVRKRCGFGCVICGVPLWHYDHIEDFSEVKIHEEENITLLCPNHHQDKTARRLPRAVVKKANARPFNALRKATAPHRWHFEGEIGHCLMGKNYLGCNLGNEGDQFDAISIRGEGVIGFIRRDDEILLNLRFLDFMQKPVLVIYESEIIISTSTTDVRIEGRSLTIEPALGLPDIKIKKYDSLIEIVRGHFIRPGQSVVVTPDQIQLLPQGTTFINNAFFNFRVGLKL